MSFILLIFSAGCKTTHKASTPKVKDERKTVDKTAPDLQQLISENSFKSTTLTAKAAVKAVVGDQSTAFNINLRLLRTV
ncbi:MAG: hypothetical protein IPP71_04765 [Bacteroidetes bacterium]|nr:hypothetical protein [Bacteroidota bacterium]